MNGLWSDAPSLAAPLSKLDWESSVVVRRFHRTRTSGERVGAYAAPDALGYRGPMPRRQQNAYEFRTGAPWGEGVTLDHCAGSSSAYAQIVAVIAMIHTKGMALCWK